MTNQITPADTLSALELLAIGEEREHRYGAQALRTITHVIDGRPWPIYERIRLLAIAAYDKKTESHIRLTATASMRKALQKEVPPPAHIAYVCFWENWCVPLSPDEATALLETRELPEGKRPVAPEPVAADAAFWDSLNRKAANTAPDGGRPPLTPRRRSTTRLLPALTHDEAVERMKEMERS